MAATTRSQYTALTKKLYADGFDEVATRLHPFLDELHKEGGWTGDGTFNFPVVYEWGQGIGTTLAAAQAAESATKAARFALTEVDRYAHVKLGAKLIWDTKDRKGSFVDAFTYEVDGQVEGFGNQLGVDAYGSGSGSIGRIAAGGISGDVLTLENAIDVRNFHVGMTVAANDTDNATSMRVGTTTVASVDIDAGTVTLTSVAAIAALAAQDYLFRSSDQGATASGLAAWIPTTAPTAGDSFFGVDRSVFVQGLAGWRSTDTTTAIEDVVLDLGAKVTILGGRTDRIYANPLTISDMLKRASSKLFREQGEAAEIGFSGIIAHLPSGTAKVMADPDCPRDKIYGLNIKSWFAKYKGPKFVHYAEEDGNLWRAISDADEYAMRIRAWWNIGCKKPGWNWVAKVAT